MIVKFDTETKKMREFRILQVLNLSELILCTVENKN